MQTSMKAAVISQFGEASEFKLQANVTIPEIDDNEVLIQTHYASVNPIDWKTRKGLGWGANAIKDLLPWVLGFDFSGTVAKIGKDVQGIAVNDCVCGTANMLTKGGSYAEYTVATASDISKIPNGIDFETAAALPLAGLTAWQALELVNVHPQSKVLILAGAGGVGHICAQLARQKTTEVSATASTKNQAFVQSLGVTAIDYQSQSLTNEYYDVIIDFVGAETGKNGIAALKKSGAIVTIPTITAEDIIETAKNSGRIGLGLLRHSDCTQLDAMLDSVAAGELAVEIAQNFDLTDIQAAHELSETGHVRGKITLKVR